MDRQAQLIAESLQPHEVKALRILVRRSIGGYERLASMTGLGQTMIDRLVECGFAEKGVMNSYTGEVGYGATKLGSSVFSALKQRKPKSNTRLKMLYPRMKALPPRG